MSRYDLIVVGGGLAGASLAKAMAAAGARVLVLERERRFRDRVRGEGMHPWGIAEARALGLGTALTEAGAREVQFWTSHRGNVLRRRDLVATSPARAGEMTFYHPAIQERLLRLAGDASAEVRRGVTVTGLNPGSVPSVRVAGDGVPEMIEARLVVAADGRQSHARRWGGFDVHHEPPWLTITGVLLEGGKIPVDTISVFGSPAFGQTVLLFPLDDVRCRAYFCTGRRAEHSWLSGERHLDDFIARTIQTGAPGEWFENIRAAGPLATFEAADHWVENPYGHGVVLIGDAAASSDPCFGCGLSLTLRDVRVLRDYLLATDDWSLAARRYADEHDRYYGALHTAISWRRTVLYALGTDADRIREHALPQIARGVGPDVIGKGPDCAVDEEARVQFLGS